jgi:hypothetical protein
LNEELCSWSYDKTICEDASCGTISAGKCPQNKCMLDQTTQKCRDLSTQERAQQVWTGVLAASQQPAGTAKLDLQIVEQVASQMGVTLPAGTTWA